MAFVFRSERNIELSGKENNTLLGPGRYVGHKPYVPKPQPYDTNKHYNSYIYRTAPFSIMTGREDPMAKTVKP